MSTFFHHTKGLIKASFRVGKVVVVRSNKEDVFLRPNNRKGEDDDRREMMRRSFFFL